VKARAILTGISAVVLAGFILYSAAPVWAVDEVDRIREKCDEFFSALTKRRYDLHVKHKEPQIARTHNDYSYLFKQRKADLLLERAQSTSDPDEARAMRLLNVALRHAAVRSYAAEDMDQMYEFIMTAKVNMDGSTIPFGQVPRVLALEEDRDVRRQIFISYNTPLEPLGVFKSGILSKMEERLGEWGFDSYLNMLSEVREVDLPSLETQARAFLDSTDALYTTEVGRLLQDQLGMGLRRARGYDIPFILKGTWVDGGIDAQRAEEIVDRTLDEMDLKAEKSKLELKPMEFCGQRDRPEVFPLRIPDEIKMCYSEAGGVCDYAAHLYMRGKAEYFASIRRPEWFELRRLGDESLAEAAGFLFRGLMSNERWLVEKAGLDPGLAEAVARHQAFVCLFRGREACVNTIFQIAVYSNGADPGQTYSDLLDEYMKWDPVLDRNRGTLALDDLESADTVLGFFLASQIRSVLEDRFGESWYASAEAGAFLKELWSPGQSLNAASMAKTLGHNEVDSSFMVADLSKIMSSGD